MAKNKKTWKMEKGTWVQYQNGVKTGKTRRTPLPAIKAGAKVATGLATRPLNQLRKGASFAKRVGMEAMHMPTKKQKEEAAKLREEFKARKAEKEAKRESLKNKNQPPANPPANKTKKPDTPTKKSDALKVSKDNSKEKAAWIKKTRNSPAAKSGAFTDNERWAQQQKHRAWKASRKKKKR
jgi:hypothetical protein